jgi:hypothetical protein
LAGELSEAKQKVKAGNLQRSISVKNPRRKELPAKAAQTAFLLHCQIASLMQRIFNRIDTRLPGS